MKLQKGMIISTYTAWYIVIEIHFDKVKNEVIFYCICDHANNIHRLSLSDIHSFMTLDEIANAEWKEPDRIFPKNLIDRGIPRQIILEALCGKHDDRFDHWSEFEKGDG